MKRSELNACHKMRLIAGLQILALGVAFVDTVFAAPVAPGGRNAAMKSDEGFVSIFNGKNLDGWYTYLKGRGKNCDPRGVFTVADGVLRISGEEFGGLVTEKEYSNYRLTVEYRFTGGKQYASKIGHAPDSGILLHSTGKDGQFGGVWMESLEVNVVKGATGDFWGVGVSKSDKVRLTARVADEKLNGRHCIFDPTATNTFTITGNTRICRLDIARDWKDTNTVAEAVNERPIGEWNRVEIACRGDEIEVYFNGKFVNRGFGAQPQRGRIQLQSEGCPIEFRKVELAEY